MSISIFIGLEIRDWKPGFTDTCQPRRAAPGMSLMERQTGIERLKPAGGPGIGWGKTNVLMTSDFRYRAPLASRQRNHVLRGLPKNSCPELVFSKHLSFGVDFESLMHRSQSR